MAPRTIERAPFHVSRITSPLGSVSSENPTDGLDEFTTEAAPLAKLIKWSRRQASPVVIGVAAATIGVVAGASGALVLHQWFARTARSASLTIETAPSGLEVSIDGTSRGRTPLTLTLPPRSYEAVVGSGTDRRIIKATLAAGAAMVQRLELTASPAQSEASHSILLVDSVPTGLPIKIDGTERGVSPLMLENLRPGEHDVVLASGRDPAHRKVSIRAGETLSILLTAGAVQSSFFAGWVSVDAPIALQIREAGKLLGSTETERLLIPVGNHTLDFINAELGFSQRLTVNVAPGKVSAVHVKVPNGTLSLNAQPWAEVWIDGTAVGETPIGNLVRPIGRHEVLFRHPELGERRETVMVTALQPTRLGVDLRRKNP